MSFGIETFAPPLKCKLPLLEYDIALYCSEFCKWTEGVWPEYLVDFKEKSFLTLGSLSGLSLK